MSCLRACCAWSAAQAEPDQTGLRTSPLHPNFLSDALLDAVAELPKVMEHLEVPVQAVHDEVLERMKMIGDDSAGMFAMDLELGKRVFTLPQE